MKSLTVQMVVKNEPFIYYSVKSIYDDADVIMLVDTVSDDKYTKSDIDRILDEDVDKKIEFKSIPIEVDQTPFTHDKWEVYAEAWKGKFACGRIRQMQIDDTKTDYFMQVDGDEVHYDNVVKRIKELILPQFSDEILWARLPFYMFCDTKHILGYKKAMGRIFTTKKMYVTADFPEMHYVRELGRYSRSRFCMEARNITPFAHFETYLKPWRKPSLDLNRVMRPAPALPEVMTREPFYIERFEKVINE